MRLSIFAEAQIRTLLDDLREKAEKDNNNL
jgi:hypothetical protein